MIPEEEISRRVDAQIPPHPLDRLWVKLGLPFAAASAAMIVVFFALPDRIWRAGIPFATAAAIMAHLRRDQKVMSRNFERSLLWEELYRKSRKPHKFKNCRIYYAQNHASDYLYLISLDDGRFIECVSEDIYYYFKDGFPDKVTLEAAASESVTFQIKQSGPRDLADPIIIEVDSDYEPQPLKVYSDRLTLPSELLNGIMRSEQAVTPNGP